jgi:hypothetical protein
MYEIVREHPDQVGAHFYGEPRAPETLARDRLIRLCRARDVITLTFNDKQQQDVNWSEQDNTQQYGSPLGRGRTVHRPSITPAPEFAQQFIG